MSNLYPQVYIDLAIPKGWAIDYPCCQPRDFKQARLVIEKYQISSSKNVLGIDLRIVNYKVQYLFLKFLETTTLKVILRLKEPVAPTILSRMSFVSKIPLVEEVNILHRLLGNQVIAQKVFDLK